MIRRLFLVLTAVSAMLLWSATAYAQGNEEFSAGIYSGRCGDIGDEVRRLNVPQFETGDWQGTQGAPRVLESDTDDIGDVSANELFDTPHVVVVLADADVVACGEIGGHLGDDDDEDLLFGLRPIDDSEYVGVAVVNDIDDDDDEFEVEVYVVYPESLDTSAD